MVERNYDDLDSILRRREVPPPRSNLAERIIEASLQKKPGKEKADTGWLKSFKQLFVPPRPAYALAVFILLGIAGGFYYQGPAQESDDAYLDAYFLYIDDVIGEEEWS